MLFFGMLDGREGAEASVRASRDARGAEEGRDALRTGCRQGGRRRRPWAVQLGRDKELSSGLHRLFSL